MRENKEGEYVIVSIDMGLIMKIKDRVGRPEDSDGQMGGKKTGPEVEDGGMTRKYQLDTCPQNHD
jgi:hypothetical protein